MEIGSILRRMADIFDQAMNDEVESVQLHQVEIDNNEEISNGDSPMVSPLQQEHELFKKATGVENNVDQFAQDEAPGDELADLISLAGVDGHEGTRDYADTIAPVSVNPRATAAQEYHENKNK